MCRWAEPWPDPAARLYALALDRSDYAGHVAALLQRRIGSAGSLLDIGAGGGHIGGAWLQPGTPWTALEPNRYLRARLFNTRAVQQRYVNIKPHLDAFIGMALLTLGVRLMLGS